MNTHFFRLSMLSIACSAILSACGGGGPAGALSAGVASSSTVGTAGSTASQSGTVLTNTAPQAPAPTTQPTTTTTVTTTATPTNLCSGVLVTGKGLVNYSAMAKPAKLQATTDPDFRTQIIRVTDAKADWNSGVAVPAYGTIQAWNADESLMILYVTDPLSSGGKQGWALFDGKTYAFKQWLDINPADVEQFYWSTSNPALIYYVDNHQSGSVNYDALTVMNVITGVKTVIHDFAPDMQSGGKLAGVCPYSALKVSGGEDPFAMSKDNDLIGLGCYLNKNGPGGSAAFQAFSYRISTNTIGTPFLVEADVPQALPSGRGTYFYNGTNQVQTLNAVTNAVTRTIPFDGSQHSDLLQNAAGDDIIAGVQFDGPSGSGTLMWANLTKGGPVQTLIGQAVGDPYPPTGTLVSGRAFNNPGWLAVAITGCPAGSNGNCSGSTPVGAANPQTYLDQEILLANVDTGQMCRIAHNRTTGNYANSSNSNYWAQPNVIISPRGTRILFASDWGAANPKSPTVNGSAVVDTYVITLPSYKP